MDEKQKNPVAEAERAAWTSIWSTSNMTSEVVIWSPVNMTLWSLQIILWIGVHAQLEDSAVVYAVPDEHLRPL